jgi:hypothetical protein
MKRFAVGFALGNDDRPLCYWKGISIALRMQLLRRQIGPATLAKSYFGLEYDPKSDCPVDGVAAKAANWKEAGAT